MGEGQYNPPTQLSRLQTSSPGSDDDSPYWANKPGINQNDTSLTFKVDLLGGAGQSEK